MFPGGFPILPVAVFPSMLVPALDGLTAVDVTAAVAAIVWALGGLVALRIAIVMSRDHDGESDRPTAKIPPTHSPSGFRDAA